LSVVGVALGLLRLRRTATAPDADRGLDAAGIGLFAATLVALLLFLMDIALSRAYLMALAALGATAFTLRERRARRPFIDLKVLSGNAPLLATYARVLLSNIISYAFIYGYTQWLEDGRDLSASQAGLILLPMFATGIAVSAVTGRRPEIRGKLLAGSAVQLLVCALLPLLDGGSPIWALVAVGMVLGIPQGINNLANQNALYFQADPARVASSAGLLRTFAYLGAISASAAAGAFFGARADTTGLHHLALFLIAIAALSCALVVGDRSLASATEASATAR
jgi:hypothetical protein